MQLHRLTFRAIGPYAAEHSIDFAAIGRSSVFLLEGPTGSGKSTIIDALVFALYGSLAGETASADRLHSHHADPHVEPFVELVFETAAGLHRVRRTPAWVRPKSRGTGTTRANASAALVRLATPDATDGEVLSTSTQEVGGEIARIVGLTRQQFVQTVVLPQGEFAKFLGASGEERRLVLQSLFGTEVYERTTAELVEARRAANGAIEAADRAVALAGERLREASGGAGVGDVGAGADADGGADATGGGDTVGAGDAGAAAEIAADGDMAAEVAVTGNGEGDIAAPPSASPAAWRERLLGHLEAAVATARSSRDSAASAVAAARAHVASQTQLARLLKRRADLLTRRAAHEAEAERQEAARARLALGRRAAIVTGPLAAAQKAEIRSAETAAERSRRAARHPRLAALSAADLSARRDAALAEIAALTSVVTLERGFAGREEEAVRDAARVAREADSISQAEQALAERAPARVPVAAALQAAEAAVRDVEPAAAAVAAAQRSVEQVGAVAGLAAAATAAAERRTAAAESARQAVDTEAHLRRRRIEGIAGELARSLTPGEPCVVCGSTEHPALAALTDEHPDDDAVERAVALREAADRALGTASAEAAVAVARHEAEAARLDGLDRAAADAALATARQSLEMAENSAAAAGSAKAALDAFDATTERDRASLAGRREARAEASASLDAVRAALAADRSHVASRLGERAASAAALHDSLTTDRSALDDMLEAVAADDAAALDRAEASAALALALAEAEFDTAEEAEGAAVSRAELASLAEQVSRADNERAVVDDGLADAEIAALTGDESADVESAESTLAVAEQTLDGCASQLGRVEDRLDRTRSAIEALEAAESAAAEVAEEARAIVRMADVASASSAANTAGVTLGTYVLLRRFDDVVAAANARLQVMSSGRYRLEPSSVKEAGRARKVGLALVIRDNTTDTTRDPKSFSGGETFYASLSLALGLADVVQAEAGGLDLGTLFVDEGFGSLDPETLDAVMTELGRLSAHGRVVGIVSHVEELKQRIADRIEVRRLPSGASTLTSTAG